MRWIVRLIGVVVVVALVAVGSLFLIPADRIGGIVADQFERATGRSLTIAGDIRPSLYPTLGVRAEGVELGNPAWVEAGPMLRAERLHVGVELWALFTGAVRVQRFELVRPEIVLVQGADGAVSWDFSDGAPPGEVVEETAEAESGIAGFALDVAEISDGALLYIDQGTGTEVRAGDLDLTLTLPSAEGVARLEGNGALNGGAVAVEAAIDGLGPLLEGALRPVALALTWEGGEAGFDGRVGLSPLGVEGQVALDATDLGPLLAMAGQATPALPQGLGRDRLAVEGDFTLASEGTAHLREARFTFDDNALSGDIDVMPGDDRPRIRAVLSGGALDLSALTGGDDAANRGDSTGNGGGWSRTPIDVSGLFAVDADAALVLAGLDLGIMQLGAVDLRATLDAGRLVFDLREVNAYDGGITGQYVINGRGGLSMGADLAIAGVRLSPLLSDFAGYERLEGTGDAELDVLMVGNDMHSLMNSAEGSGQVRFGQGAILGLDIWGMIRNLDTSYQGEGQRTVYDSITARFDIQDGVVSNDDLLLSAPFGDLTGAGTVGVGAQVLNYTVVPRVTTGQGAGLRVPLRISGAWSDPNFSLDLEALAEQELAGEIDALEERATGAVSEALGIAPAEGQSLEDAAEDELENRLREEAGRQLERLLGGN
ncbi:MAG: AsmA family protein [Nioella sp.]